MGVRGINLMEEDEVIGMQLTCQGDYPSDRIRKRPWKTYLCRGILPVRTEAERCEML